MNTQTDTKDSVEKNKQTNKNKQTKNKQTNKKQNTEPYAF